MRGSLVLVVDDDPAIREVLGEVLADEGYRVHAAADGREALEMVASAPPHLILSDVRMPHVDGLELVRRLRSLDHGMPVVLISAHSAGVDLPGVHFLAKPFDLDAITRAVEDGIVAAR
jgi:CheY-like chemotaxis protein